MCKTVVLAFMVGALCPVLYSQQTNVASGKAVIDVAGVKLHLGMTKQEVQEKLAGERDTHERLAPC